MASLQENSTNTQNDNPAVLPDVVSYRITTGMGNLTAGQLPFLNESELKEFEHVGYSGKDFSGKTTSLEDYLNSLGKGDFSVLQTGFDNGSGIESFVIGRVPAADPQQAPKAQVFHLETSQGRHLGLGLPFLSEFEHKELDCIGYSGKDLSGNKTTMEDYLNSLGRGTFTVTQTGFDDASFRETFTVARSVDVSWTDQYGAMTPAHPKMATAIEGTIADATFKLQVPAAEFLEQLTYVRAWQIADESTEVIRTSEEKLDAFNRFKGNVQTLIDKDAVLNRNQQRAVCRYMCENYDKDSYGVEISQSEQNLVKAVNECTNLPAPQTESDALAADAYIGNLSLEHTLQTAGLEDMNAEAGLLREAFDTFKAEVSLWVNSGLTLGKEQRENVCTMLLENFDVSQRLNDGGKLYRHQTTAMSIGTNINATAGRTVQKFISFDMPDRN